MMSRPFGSAPSTNFPSALSHCGPIGTPSKPTTFFCLPSTVIVSDRWFSVGGRLRDVLRPQRGGQARGDQQDEEEAEGQRSLVAPQAAHAKPPRSDAVKLLPLRLGLPGRRALEPGLLG